MRPFYDDGQAVFWHGDVVAVLEALPAASVHCVVTSPPYWALRDYGVEGQIGLEPTPEAFVARLVAVFRAVRRVLRPDGTLWLNLGDSYAGSGVHAAHHANPGMSRAASRGAAVGNRGGRDADPKRAPEGLPELGANRSPEPGLKDGDLIGVPWRVALALQADGWWLRSDVVWAKPNPMPESVAGWRWERHMVRVKPSARAKEGSAHAVDGFKPQGARDGDDFADHGDEREPCPGCATCEPNEGLVLRRGSWRPTSAHEYLFELTPSGRYYGDGEPVREPLVSGPSDLKKMTQGLERIGGKTLTDDAAQHKANASTNIGRKRAVGDPSTGRNRRSVWDIATEPYAGAHFATFPEALVEPCILASTSEHGVCAACGAPWARVLAKGEWQEHPARVGRSERNVGNVAMGAEGYSKQGGTLGLVREVSTAGWRATCRCEGAGVAPAVVLDPFLGSGTTAAVAKRLGRRAVGIDLNARYLQLAIERNRQLALLAAGE